MAFRGEWFDKKNFFAFFDNPSNMFYEIGDCEGLASAMAIIPGLSAIVDFVMFDRSLKGREFTFHAILKEIFKVTSVARLTGMVPASKDVSLKLLQRLGFKREGRMRNAHRSPKGLEDVVILGLLKRQVEHWTGPVDYRTPATIPSWGTVLPGEAIIGEVRQRDLGNKLEEIPRPGGRDGDSPKEEQ